jgi:hypothetical protein
LLAHWATFAGYWRERCEGRALPEFVTKTVEAFLRCGIAAYGVIRARCPSCGADRFVPFSCKRRGLCASCTGRLMCERAWQLSTGVLGDVPVRQWVLSLPDRVRRLAAWDREISAAIVTVLAAEVLRNYRRRAQSRGIRGQSGTVTVIQRFSQTLRVHLHYHLVAIDGVYQQSERGVHLHALPAPTTEDIARVAERVRKRIERMLDKRGLGQDTTDYEMRSDDLCDREPALAQILSASLTGTVATGARQGMTQMRMGICDDEDQPRDGAQPPKRNLPLCADVAGYNVHAAVRIGARDGAGRERLLRYLLRGPLSHDRLREIDGGRLALTLRKPLRDGTTHLVFDPLELIERLIALIPWPRVHQIRYHGLLAPHAKLRPRIVARATSKEASPDLDAAATQTPRDSGLAARSRRKSWAQLLAHVFEIDILACERCGGRMKIIAAIRNRESLVAILQTLGLPTDPPTPASARAPPQPSLFAASTAACTNAASTDAAGCDAPFSDDPA